MRKRSGAKEQTQQVTPQKVMQDMKEDSASPLKTLVQVVLPETPKKSGAWSDILP
jgi:hypothetical protein